MWEKCLSKIHARGPVGLEGLTTEKYHLEGEGHLVATYAGEDAVRSCVVDQSSASGSSTTNTLPVGSVSSAPGRSLAGRRSALSSAQTSPP